MNICGTSPIYTTVNAVVRNIDAVDVAATSVSCTNLTVDGEPVSTLLQNIGSSTAGTTVFNGTVQATTLTATGSLTFPSATTGTLALTDNLTQTGGSATLKGTTVDSLTTAGNVTMSGTSASLTQSGGSATASLKAVTCTTLAPSSTITQTGGSATLKATTVDSLTTAGNVTMSGASASLTQSGASATASLKALSCTTLSTTGAVTTAGDITQSAGTTHLKLTVVDSFTCIGNQNIGGTTTLAAINQTGVTTAALKDVTSTSLTTSGNITQSAGTTTLQDTTTTSLTTDTLSFTTLSSGSTVQRSVAATVTGSSTYLDFPSYAKKVTVCFADLDGSVTAQLLLQLGSSSAAVTSGYVGSMISAFYNQSPWSPNVTAVTTGVLVANDATAHSGVVTFYHLGSNYWVYEMNHYANASGWCGCGSGYVNLGATVAARVYIQSTSSGSYTTFTLNTSNSITGKLAIFYN